MSLPPSEVPVEDVDSSTNRGKCSDPYVYSAKPGGSSMYCAVERVLASRSDWIATASTSGSFDLLIAERWAIPYARLGRDGFGGSSCGIPMVNHARGSKAITVKGLMVRSLRAHCEATEHASLDDFLPQTYLVTPGEGESQSLTSSCERKKLMETSTCENETETVWICKPTGGAHGVGIAICTGAKEAVAKVDASLESISAKKTTDATNDENKKPEKPVRISLRPKAPPAWLVQKYITNPMLIDGRKFDIRAFALVTHDRKVFWYDDFIIRTCSEQFDMADTTKKTAHISNHCVQTKSEHFGTFEEGNEMFSKDFSRYILSAESKTNTKTNTNTCGENENETETGVDSLHASIVSQMRRAVARTVNCVIDAMGGSEEYDAFQVLGYDFMPDENGKVWLLEVNGSAAAAERMTPGIAADVVELAVDRRHPPRMDKQSDSNHKPNAVRSGRWVELDLEGERAVENGDV